MKKEDLFNIIDGIDDDIILDIPQLKAEKPEKITLKKRAPFWGYVSAAAGFVCVLAVGIFAVTKIHGNITTSLPITESDVTESGVTSSIPVNSEPGQNSEPGTTSQPGTTSEPEKTGPYYDDVFESSYFNPATGMPTTYEDVVDALKPDPGRPEWDFDSLFLVETVKALTLEECRALAGWDDQYSDRTMYEVKVIKDLISGETLDRREYFYLSMGSVGYQLGGDPIYAPGEKFTIPLSKKSADYDFLRAPAAFALRYDAVETEDGIMLYFRRQLSGSLDLPGAEDIDEKVITSTTKNPAVYTQKIALDDLVSFLREDWGKRGISSHYENSPTATDLGNGMYLTGTLLDRSELEEFSADRYLEEYYFYESEEEFLDSLNNPELKELYKREHRLTSFARDPIIWEPVYSKLLSINTERPYIEGYDENGRKFRYYATGFTYDSFMNEYYKTFTKEAVDKLFQKFNTCFEYDGELMHILAGGDGLPGRGKRSEFEIISNSGSELVFRRTAFPYDLDDIPPGESAPEWFDEDITYITDFRYVRTADGWRSASLPLGYEKDKQTDPAIKTPGEPNVYFSTKSVVFPEIQKSIKFIDAKEGNIGFASDHFSGYEITYMMPAEIPVALKYLFTNGEVSVLDGNYCNIVIDPERYKKKGNGDQTFWRPLSDDTSDGIFTTIYISENNAVYIARFMYDDDFTCSINNILSLI